jgi:glutamate dehydrogenase (NAD(P)+)
MITGKPLALGGVYCLREAQNVLGINLKGGTQAIQGYGNVDTFAYKLGGGILGLKTVAVSDSKGGIQNPNGLGYEKVMVKQIGLLNQHPIINY